MMVMTAMMGLTTQNCSVAWRGDITIQEETKQTSKDTGGEGEASGGRRTEEGGREGGRGVSAPNEMGHDSLVMAGVSESLSADWSGLFSTAIATTTQGFQYFYSFRPPFTWLVLTTSPV